MTDTAQARMEDAFHLGGELVFTVRKDAPLRMTQAQARQKPHKLHRLSFHFKEPHAAQSRPAEHHPSSGCRVVFHPPDRSH